jgi:hypothetical protein
MGRVIKIILIIALVLTLSVVAGACISNLFPVDNEYTYEGGNCRDELPRSLRMP